ncbi:MAG: pyruvoyl-dependent arginine decarboxylase [bacterium]
MDNRIPNNFFITKGFGVDGYEKHAGAYHMALYDAGIADFNIMSYSSVLPPNAHLLSLDEVDLPIHGSEMYTIQSVAFGEFGENISAGIIYAWMYEDENFTKKHGGLVCEINGNYTIPILEERLYIVINNLFEKTYKNRGLFLGEPEVITQGGSVPNDVRYGCALVSICFIDYI